MSKKGICGKVLWGLLSVMAVMCVLPSLTLAYVLDVQNSYTDKMAVAIIDFADEAGTWRCHGWFEVDPNSTRRLNFPSSTAKNNIYLLAKTSEAKWSGEGYKSSIPRVVISKAFTYYDGESCPPGPNRRQEFFAKYELDDGYLFWSP